jgi:phosphate acetyltransferase
MKHTLFMVPVGLGVGLTSVTMGLVQALERHGVDVSYFNPFVEGGLNIEKIEHLLSQGKEEVILESIIRQVEEKSIQDGIIVIQGIISNQLRPYAPSLNNEISKALDAEVIFVATPGGKSPEELKEQIKIASKPYGGIHAPKLIGCMINKVGAPIDKYGNTWIDLFDPPEDTNKTYAFCHIFDEPTFKTLGCFPWERQLMAPRVSDVADYLNAEIISPGKLYENRVKFFVMAGATIENVSPSFKPDVMVITPSDRSDVIVATCIAYLNGTKIAGILLTGGYELPQSTTKLCHSAIEKGLPILSVKTDSLGTAFSLKNINTKIPKDDIERRFILKEFIASYINEEWIEHLLSTQTERRLSPPAFRYQLIEKARKANKQIILPEGEEPRIIQAALQCIEKEIARPLLLGNPEKINRIAENNGIKLHPKIKILDPTPLRQNYLELLLELRKHKSLTEKGALEALQSNIVIGTLMLAKGEVDGLVSGAIHTTAETVRPALMLIKTKKDVKRASSIFFMCLPKQVLVYGDCAINQNPNAEELANIAIQCADSAEHFGIPARVAMISYSTGTSGTGSEVEKVKEATEKVKNLRPDIIIDGPLQYDAAFSPDVANKKTHDSPVAGKATVYVFPDLNTGNTTYKAVQRSADVLSIGPILQGLNKPVNDISRGALIDDIVYTIAITAIQAT